MLAPRGYSTKGKGALEPASAPAGRCAGLCLFYSLSARPCSRKKPRQARQSPAKPAAEAASAGSAPPPPRLASKEEQSWFAPLDDILKEAVTHGNAPGAVLLVAHNGLIAYRKAVGNRTVGPKAEPMTVDTIFDVASLTKVIATTTCVMRLEQLGQIKLNDPVAKYIPDFAQNGKEDVTIRMLLTHYSGLPADVDLKQPWTRTDEGYARANASKLVNPPGSTFLYSDVGFVVLGELVQKVERHAARPVCADVHLRPAGDEFDALQSAADLGAAHCAHAARRTHRPDLARHRSRSHGAADGRRRRRCGTVLDVPMTSRSSRRRCSTAARRS